MLFVIPFCFLMCFLFNFEHFFLTGDIFLETSVTLNDKYIFMHFQLTDTVHTQYVLLLELSKIQYLP